MTRRWLRLSAPTSSSLTLRLVNQAGQHRAGAQVPLGDARAHSGSMFGLAIPECGLCKGETTSSTRCLSVVRKFLMYRSGRDLVLELEGGNPSAPDKMHTSGRIGLEFIHLKRVEATVDRIPSHKLCFE
jgi:hypothetical protein